VTLSQQPAESLKPAVLKECRGTGAHARAALDVGENLAIALYADDAGCTIEARLL